MSAKDKSYTGVEDPSILHEYAVQPSTFETIDQDRDWETMVPQDFMVLDLQEEKLVEVVEVMVVLLLLTVEEMVDQVL